MNKYAKILFEMLESNINAGARRLSKRVLGSRAAKSITPEVRRKLDAQIRDVLELQAWCFLCLFDNVGCRLPDGVLGYRILASPEVRQSGRIKHGQPLDIREGEDDYSDMWLAFCQARKKKIQEHLTLRRDAAPLSNRTSRAVASRRLRGSLSRMPKPYAKEQ